EQRPARPRVPAPAQPAPPAADRLDGELGRVAADADAHPGLVVAQVVDPVGDRLALARVGEVVRIDLVRPALGPPGLPGVLEVAQNLLLLGVDRDRRLLMPLLGAHPAVDVPELRVAVGVTPPLVRLAVGLQAVAGLLQQAAHGGRPHRVALGGQTAGQPARALAGPAQRRLRVTAAAGLDQPFQRRADAGVDRGSRLAAGARPALVARRRGVAGVQFADAAADGAVRQARGGAD